MAQHQRNQPKKDRPPKPRPVNPWMLYCVLGLFLFFAFIGIEAWMRDVPGFHTMAIIYTFLGIGGFVTILVMKNKAARRYYAAGIFGLLVSRDA
jgi:hypothetical protein